MVQLSLAKECCTLNYCLSFGHFFLITTCLLEIFFSVDRFIQLPKCQTYMYLKIQLNETTLDAFKMCINKFSCGRCSSCTD